MNAVVAEILLLALATCGLIVVSEAMVASASVRAHEWEDARAYCASHPGDAMVCDMGEPVGTNGRPCWAPLPGTRVCYSVGVLQTQAGRSVVDARVLVGEGPRTMAAQGGA